MDDSLIHRPPLLDKSKFVDLTSQSNHRCLSQSEIWYHSDQTCENAIYPNNVNDNEYVCNDDKSNIVDNLKNDHQAADKLKNDWLMMNNPNIWYYLKTPSTSTSLDCVSLSPSTRARIQRSRSSSINQDAFQFTNQIKSL